MKDIYERIDLLVNKLNKATEAYDLGEPFISDQKWDKMYFELLSLERDSSYIRADSPTQKISYSIVNKLNKVEHNHKMLSLDKTQDWSEFIRYFSDKSVIGMLKLDGLTCSLRYLNGRLVSAETRGDGFIGEDIFHNALVIPSIPKKINYFEELVVDGEIICTYKDFEQFSKEYKNPRNFASGSIRLLDAKECERRNLTFIAWNVVKGFSNSNSFLSNLSTLDTLGFKVTPYTSSFDWDAKEFLVDTAKELGYPIDGLVGRFDDIDFGNSLGETAHHTNAAFAYKFYDEVYPTKVKYIDWTMGRTGILTPVAVFEPIDIDGTTIERASMHNLSIFKESKLWFQHQKIDIYKANQIIPQIKKVYEYEDEIASTMGMKVPDYCPICHGLTRVKRSDAGIENLYCDNPACNGKIINKIDHYAGKKGLDIKGLSKATLEKLIDKNWLTSIKDLYTLKDHKTEWVQMAGFGEKSVSNILTAIEESKNCSLSTFISALGIPLIGRTVSKDIESYFNSYEDFRDAIDDYCFDFCELPNFGHSKKEALLNFDYTEADFIFDNYIIIEAQEVNSNKFEKSLENMTFCITGKLKSFKNRNELKDIIESKGGKVSNSVSGKTNYLINNDKNSQTAKNKAAIAKGIPIITEEEFVKSFLE